MISKGTNALASSIVLVCRKRGADAPTATRRDFLAALKSELPDALVLLQRGNIAPVDLAQAAIGPGMAVYTRYAKVLDASGAPLSVRDALALINQTLDEVLAEQEGDFDADSRWALTWFEVSGFDEGDYGVAEQLSKSKNTSVEAMSGKNGILESQRGKVRLKAPKDLSADWDPATDPRLTAWEMVHHLDPRARPYSGWRRARSGRTRRQARRQGRGRPRAGLPPLHPSASARNARRRHCLTTGWSRAGRRSSDWRVSAARHERSSPTCSRRSNEMAITNHERVGKGLDLLKVDLRPFVERELKAQYKQGWFDEVKVTLTPQQLNFIGGEPDTEWDIAVVLGVMWGRWNDVFRKTLGHAERSLVSELRDVRNRWAHQNPFSSDDADRALDSMARLLTAVSAPQADEVGKMKMELRRLTYDEQVRGEKRKAGGSLIEAAATGTLKPWREIVTPHADVASGRYQQAEFAADLWQVHLGEGSDEYKQPQEFFRRTFLTESLKRLLVGGVQRVSGQGGDPVVQLQTNFGGGKTHSMLALYHLFSGVNASELSGVDAVLADAGVKNLPRVKCVVLVGNKISPGNPVTKPDGTVVHTLWGELAYQLGGKKAYSRIKADDEKATNPGDVLRELFKEYGPCLILIDEWVAYARQLHDQSDLPAGGFETQFTFA